jgi:16S rRNA (guanine527-N7)-methyltransferase
VLDLGSGAGLPGIPLALARPDLEFVLLDRGARKARFLRQVVQQLGLANVTVRCQDARDVVETFACVVSRAVAGVSRLWALAEPMLVLGGTLLVLHRANPQATGSPTAVPGAKLCSHWVRVPGLSQQHEIVMLNRAGS